MLVYSVLKGIHNDSELERHLEKRSDVRRGLRLAFPTERCEVEEKVPLVRRVFEEVSDLARELTGSPLVLDSTPTSYRNDDSRTGYYSSRSGDSS